jgi:ribosomal protein S6--L-glutamate ligase
MRIAVLAAADSWYLADLRRAVAARHELTPLGFRNLSSSLLGSEVAIAADRVDLRQFDALLVRTMPPGSLEQVVFRMDLLGQLERQGVAVFNPPRAIEAAVDKYLASARLLAAGLRVPRTIVCQTPDEALSAFNQLGGDVVLKPLFGGEGRGITRLNDEALAERAFRMLAQLGSVLYLQEFLPHRGFDIRVLVIGRRILAIRRRNLHDWRTNISRGATAEPLELPAEWAELAHRAAQAIGAPLAGVDLLPLDDGPPYVLEVNAVPGWKALAAALQVDVAAEVLQFVEEEVRGVRT